MTDRVTEYAEKVVNGEIKMGRLHILACKRHLDDLKRQNTDEFPYYWDVKASQKVIEYSETLTIAEGSEPKPVKLLDCQAFDVGCTFGWKKCVNDKRRFRRRYKSVARQNGKTFENGIMGTYIAGFSGYHFGKLFTVATKKRQARLAWEEMSKFISIDPDLQELFDVKDYVSLIKDRQTNCTIEALSKESGLDDGFRSIFCSIDEIHQHKDNKIYKALYNGTRSLPETLVSMITTRGDNLNSFCKEMDDYCIKILNGNTTAEDFFVDIYCLDEKDDIWDPSNWVKANPFICAPGNEELFETLKADAQTAKDMGGSELRDFMIKCLNLWVENRDCEFVDSEKFKNCGCDKTLEDFRGQHCVVGLDLSSGGDLTTYSMEFEDDDKYYFHSHSYMPRGRMLEHVQTDLAPYDLWEQMELITVTGGEMDFKNDYGFIIKELRELQEKYELTYDTIAVDPHNFDGIREQLENFACPVICVKQSCRSLNDATVDMQLLVKSEKIEYNSKNELLIWSFLNAQTVSNSFDEIKVDKRDGKRQKRIDPVDACIDAHSIFVGGKDKVAIDVKDALQSYLDALKGGEKQ
jgi:phage terminase large subunit-like protein